jgi:autoinducer 2 (AI-2) kinase
MGERFLMGLDLGGGSARALLLGTVSGRCLAVSRPFAPQAQPDVPMGSAFETEPTWSLLAQAAREALARAGVARAAVVGVAATGMRHGSVLVDAQGRALLATPNRDARGLPAVLELAARDGAALHRSSGHWPNPVQPAGRLLWLARERPALLARAAAHLSVSDWLGFQLTGVAAAEPSQAAESLLFELAPRRWAWEWIDRLGLPRRIFPEVRDAGTPLGALTPAAAERLGLTAGIPVAVGGADTQCGLLGAGVVAAGQVGVVAGTSSPVLALCERPRLEPDGRLWSVPHVIPGLWAIESNGGAVGEALAWMAGLLYREHAHPLPHLFAEAGASGPGAAGMLSTLGAERMDARRLGLPLGTLTLTPLVAADDPARRRHLARAVVEGVSYGLLANVEQAEAAAGVHAAALRLTGGVSRSALFAQLLADVSGRAVEVAAVHEASALGAALCAGVVAGVFASLPQAAGEIVRIARRCEPQPEARAAYAELRPAWSELAAARAESDAKAAALALRGFASAAGAARGRAASAFRPRILVAADLDEEGLEALRGIGEVEAQSFRKAMRLLTGPSLARALEGVHVFVTEVDVVNAEALVEAGDLRVIAVCRGDAVNVDLEACTGLGIPVLHTPGRNADAVADLTLAFLLALARKLVEANAFLREPGGKPGDMGRMGRAFTRLQGRELWRKTVGLVGLGAVGRKVVERLRPFGARCLVHDPFLDDDAIRLTDADPATLEELLAASDFVTLHAAVTERSRGLIGAAELARMRPGACLVNTARAALVDEPALIDALVSGRLAGAALDVFAVEPPGADHPLLRLPNVIATPHVGGNTVEVAAHQARIVADELERLRRGEAPRHALNPATLAGFRWDQPRPAASAETRERLRRRPAPTVTDLEKRPAPRPAAAVAAAPPAAGPPPRAGGALGDPKIREKMQRLLEAFVEAIVADPELARRAGGGHDVTLHFVVSDLGQAFHFGFRGGALLGGMGPPAGSADVQLELSADLLDGMFTGRRNAMQAAMNGELSFSGDTAKAMTLQHLNADLGRLYQGVRERLGDPGDLASLAAPAERPAPSGPALAAADDPRPQIVAIVNELYAAQLITATGGNVSLRAPDDPSQAWITPSQLFKGDLHPEILVRIGMDGRAVAPGGRSPSSEALMHTAVLAARPDVQAVIHCHAPWATILANSGLPFLPISTEAAFLVGIGRIPFVMPGTRELADAVVAAMGKGWAVLMQNHGLLVAGRSLRRAADMCEIVERTAQVIVGCYSVGKPPPVLPEETVQTLARYGDLMA